jgi:alkylation response protein AidB-like acyl-CoA dehydrogenase
MTDTTDQLTLERQSLAQLLERNQDDSGAAAALGRDGWYDLSPDPSGWQLAGSALLAVSVVAAAERAVPIAARLAAGAAFAAAGQAVPSAGQGGWSVATDASLYGDEVRAALWGSGEQVILGPLDGRLFTVHAAALRAQPAGDEDVRDRYGSGPVAADRTDLRPLTDEPQATSRFERHLALLSAADAIGAAERAVALTDAYTRQRTAFGYPLASQQVVQHRIVDMHIALSTMQAAAAAAARAEQTSEPGAEHAEVALAAWAAKSVAGRQAPWIIEQAIQLHGGIGFTWERGLHWSLHRAQRSRQVLGGRRRAGTETLSAYRMRRRPAVADWSVRANSRSPHPGPESGAMR